MALADGSYEDRYYAAADGVRLHLRDYRPVEAAGAPAVCLAGLTRMPTISTCWRASWPSRRRSRGGWWPWTTGGAASRTIATTGAATISRRNGRTCSPACGSARSRRPISSGTSRGGLHLMAAARNHRPADALRRPERHRAGSRARRSARASRATSADRCRRPTSLRPMAMLKIGNGDAFYRPERAGMAPVRDHHVRHGRGAARPALRSGAAAQPRWARPVASRCPTCGASSTPCTACPC